MENKIAICVLIINKKMDTFLSVSLKNDHTDFNLPGGKVEIGETNEEAGIREVQEETGLLVDDLKFLYKGYDNDFKVITFYTYTYKGEIYTIENHIVKWLPLYYLTQSKKWPEYNSEVYNNYLRIL